ncbi:Conserved exported hypothetical protein [Desulfamplus magnetovallimortis]|uniref:Uncharacterized protein n=1 Tax=Desulfamplus magnetovallimortis TaxID=1246637 RepID=A0A1W1HA13_9BACT|nr:substrate-binding domain-containing protein [Desulfamplus magnetovallimortis]SLM29330.1 Conserved exported hypothetical protein [Desulfamplus magnetovallimortis]
MKFLKNIFLVIITVFSTIMPIAVNGNVDFKTVEANAENIEQVAVIVNLDNPSNQLSAKEISDIYLGRRRSFPDGSKVVVLERDSNCKLREIFFRLLNGMTLKRLNAYWARLQFSGAVQPPIQFDDSSSVVDVVRTNPHAIGYINAQSVDESVKVVLMLRQ